MAQNGRFGSPSVGLLLGLAAAAPALAASAALALAWSSEMGMFSAIALSLVAGSISAWLIARYFAQPIDEAIGLATRFAAGETELRLDPSRGVPKFRDFATVLNSIADKVTDREQMFELVSAATGDAVWDWDAGSGATNWTGELRTLFGVPEDRFSAPHDWWIGRIHPEDRQRVARSLATAVSASESRWASEYRFRLEDGSYRWFWDRGVTLRDKCGQVQRAIGCMTDITGQRAAEERIWQLANQDELTKLPNRALFYRRLAALLQPQDKRGGAVLLVDIVDFRTINGTHGHPLGDGLLKSFGARLQESVGARGSAFRLGGDKFAIILPETSERSEVEEITLFLLGRVREPFFLESQILSLTATIGVVLFPENGSTPSELMKNADVALYAGKAQERNRIAFFDPEMRRAREQKVALLSQIGRGLDGDQFEPHYQPIISLKDGTIVGAEALTRWTHPTEGLVGPAFFGSAYDDPELAVRLGKRLMEKVVDHYARWRDCGVAPPYLAVNVSAPGFRLPDLAKRLLQRFEEAGLPNSCFVIEVTETVLLTQDAGYVESNLRQLSAAGVHVALDDFGTGYASLTHLQEFPVDIIKIDKSFVGSMTSDTGSQAIVSAVLELGRRLDKSVIAEGVETMEQAAMLRAAGCRSAQGYLFAKPMPAEAFARFSAKQLGRLRRTA